MALEQLVLILQSGNLIEWDVCFMRLLEMCRDVRDDEVVTAFNTGEHSIGFDDREVVRS